MGTRNVKKNKVVLSKRKLPVMIFDSWWEAAEWCNKNHVDTSEYKINSYSGTRLVYFETMFFLIKKLKNQ